MPALARPCFEANPEASKLIGCTSTGHFFHPQHEGNAQAHARDTSGELVTVTREEAEAASAAAPAPKAAAAKAPTAPAAAKSPAAKRVAKSKPTATAAPTTAPESAASAGS